MFAENGIICNGSILVLDWKGNTKVKKVLVEFPGSGSEMKVVFRP